MIRTLTMPRLGETMTEGRPIAWLVKTGEAFKRGDPILEVETDKTVVEFPALGDGTLVESLVDLGEMVEVGAPLANIDMGDGLDWIGSGGGEVTLEPKDTDSTGASIPQQTLTNDLNTNTKDNNLTSTTERVRATPLARKLARDAQIDINEVKGSGRRGRIEKADVNALLQNTSAESQTGYNLAWKRTGAGVPIVLLHGFAADHDVWAGLSSQLVHSGHELFAVDLPAHGATVLEARHPDAFTTPLIKSIQDQFGDSPVHIVAHSMGAIAAVAVATQRAVSSLTLIAPAGVGRTIDTNFLEELANPRSIQSVANTLDRMTHCSNGLSDSAIESIYQNLSQGRLVSLAKSLAGASGQAIDIRADLCQLATKTSVSIILGHRDRILRWSEALDISPYIAIHHITDAGHMPHWEALFEVKTIIERNVRQ